MVVLQAALRYHLLNKLTGARARQSQRLVTEFSLAAEQWKLAGCPQNIIDIQAQLRANISSLSDDHDDKVVAPPTPSCKSPPKQAVVSEAVVSDAVASLSTEWSAVSEFNLQPSVENDCIGAVRFYNL